MKRPRPPSTARTTERLGDPAGVFAALGDPTRLALVTRLAAAGPQTVTRLTRRSGVTRQAVTKHLGVLERAGLVRARRSGRERLWQVEPERLVQTRRYLETISAQWDDALERLKTFAEQS